MRLNTPAEINEILRAAKRGEQLEFSSSGNSEGLGFISAYPSTVNHVIELGFTDFVFRIAQPKITVRLNDTHTAVVSSDKKTVTVGCQTFDRDAILKVAEALK